MSSRQRVGPVGPDADAIDPKAGWDAALAELRHQAQHLEARGALRAAVTLYDAIRIARAGGLACEHRSPA